MLALIDPDVDWVIDHLKGCEVAESSCQGTAMGSSNTHEGPMEVDAQPMSPHSVAGSSNHGNFGPQFQQVMGSFCNSALESITRPSSTEPL